MALLRGLQLSNSLEKSLWPWRNLIPSQRCWHGQNTPQKTEYLRVHVEEIHTPGQRQDGNFLISAHPFNYGAGALFFLGRAEAESMGWGVDQETQGWGHQSSWPLPAQRTISDTDLICSDQASNLKHLHGTMFLRRKHIPGSWTLKLQSSFKAPENLPLKHIIPLPARPVSDF